jgi:tryptophan synthase alpha chain
LSSSVSSGRLEAALRSGPGLGLIPYVMAGYPDPAGSVALARRFGAAGAAAIEIGIPFSDPLADGPVIQAAGQAALAGGMTLPRALVLAGEVAAAQSAPVVLMTYLNPVLAHRPERFAAAAAAAGVAGVIIPDLPAEEAAPIAGVLRDAGLDSVFLVAPTTDDDRMAEICRRSSGFVYCVTLTGTTGARSELPAALGELLDRVRRHTRLPLAAGFGISRPEHLRALRGHADAAVVASALIAETMAGRDPLRLMSTLFAACRSEV